jgi:phosphate butyryltransferase
VETVNPKIRSTVDAEVLKGMDFGDAVVEGPMALDAALSRSAAEIKGIDSAAAGKPDILIFPELNSANAVYKALALHPGCRRAGMVTGLRIPVVLTSRSESEEVRLLSLKMAMADAGRSSE